MMENPGQLSAVINNRFFAAKPLVWLGERSFSLYLIHVPVLMAALHAFRDRLPVTALLPGAFAACFGVAELFWRGVERPAMELSRSLGRRLAGRPRHPVAIPVARP